MKLYSKMLLCSLFTLISLCSFGCLPHSVGGKSITGETLAPGGSLSSGKKMYIAVTAPISPDNTDTPEFIIVQFCKYLAPMAASVSAGGVAQDTAAAISEARKDANDYLVLLHPVDWRKGSILAPGVKVRVDITILDVATEQVLTRHQIQSNCYMMAMGLEASPRECIRPEVDRWKLEVFSASSPTNPHTDMNTFPK